MIFFSVIIPTYNRAKFIEETVKTVLAQTFTGFEIIVVDDGSTDHTEEVIRNAFGDQERVRYFKKQNEERGAARNFGLKKASGTFAVFFDSDDLMKKDYLQTLYEVIAGDDTVEFLAAKYNFLTEKGVEKNAPVHSLKEGWYDRSFFLEGNILAANYCIRIDQQDFHLFPPERELASMEDWMFIILNTGKRKVFIRDRVCLSMRQHDERSMGDNQKVILARQRATAWLLKAIPFSRKEQSKLQGWSHYFCGIHQYLDHRRIKSVSEAFRAIRKAGIRKKFILLLVKSLIGRKWMLKVK